MNDWRLAITALDDLVGKIEVDISAGERGGIYAGARWLLADLREFVRDEVGGHPYALEKIGKAKWHFGAALGFDIDNGHPTEQHRAWAYGALNSLRSTLEQITPNDD